MNREHSLYDKHTIANVRTIYLLAIFFWIILVLALGVYRTDIIGFVLISIPVLVFTVNIYYADRFSIGEGKNMLQSNIMTFGFLITAVILNWNNPNVADKSKFFRIIVVSFILLMISMIDIWVPPNQMILIRNLKSALQTMALSLLSLSLYVYYIEHSNSH
jgi:hypothetical protein